MKPKTSKGKKIDLDLSEMDSDEEDIIIIKKQKKKPRGITDNKSISQLLYNIITSDYVKGLSQDMIKFAAMFLLTSYLKGEPFPIRLFSNAINREVRDASTAVDDAAFALDIEDDPEHKLPIVLSALRNFQESKIQDPIDIDELQNSMSKDIDSFINSLDEAANPKGAESKDPESKGDGLKSIKGGGQGTRTRATNNTRATDNARRIVFDYRANSIPELISLVTTEAITYARRNNIPNRVLQTVLQILARSAVLLLIYGVIHGGAMAITNLITHYMDYKAMFTHYMEEYKNKRTPKTAKDISEDEAHYKSWTSENSGGSIKKKSKNKENPTDEIKEIEESSWFKRFYKNTIKPTAKKMYDVVTSDEAVTAAKISAQILILSLLMYAANNARLAMYNSVAPPLYNEVLRELNKQASPSDIIFTDTPRRRALLDVIEMTPPPIIREIKPRVSHKQLREMSAENRQAFFRANPKSGMKRYFGSPRDISNTAPLQRYFEAPAEEKRPSVAERIAKLDEKGSTPIFPKGYKGTGLYKPPGMDSNFYKFMVSEKAKKMSKDAVIGIIGTVLTILAAQQFNTAKANPLDGQFVPPLAISESKLPESDLSYFGIPNY